MSKTPLGLSTDFGIILCGGVRNSCVVTNDVRRYKPDDDVSLSILPQMTTSRENPKVVRLKGCVYVIGGFNKQEGDIQSVEMYSLITKSWKNITNIYDDQYCVTAFNDVIYVIEFNVVS